MKQLSLKDSHFSDYRMDRKYTLDIISNATISHKNETTLKGFSMLFSNTNHERIISEKSVFKFQNFQSV